MIARWDSSLSLLPVAGVQFPATAEYFKGVFPGWSHSANPSWASVAENGSIYPQWHHTTCAQRGGRPKSNHGQTMADRRTSLRFSNRSQPSKIICKKSRRRLFCMEPYWRSYLVLLAMNWEDSHRALVKGVRNLLDSYLHHRRATRRRWCPFLAWDGIGSPLVFDFSWTFYHPCMSSLHRPKSEKEIESNQIEKSATLSRTCSIYQG